MSNERTQSQIDASKANGALSNGPVTDEGKARSSENATKHGIFSKKVIINGESQEEFDQLAHAIDDRWRPATEEEREAVRELILLRWRIRRASTVEAQLLTTSEDVSESENAAQMFRQMDNLSKYHARLRRLEVTGEQRLREIQETRLLEEKEQQDQLHKHEREVANARKQAKRFLLNSDILRDPLEKNQTVEQILGVDEVPTDLDVLAAMLREVDFQHKRELQYGTSAKPDAKRAA